MRGAASRTHRLRLAASLAALGIICPLAVNAQLPADPTPVLPAGSELKVSLITIDYGDAIWQNFGHNAIRIHDSANGTDIAYNYGMFDFDEPGFLGRFLKGTMRYWMQDLDFGRMVAYYQTENRSVVEQELRLTPAQRVELRRFLEWNVLPENRYYVYDYFRDNCSTRVRDALDRVLEGALRNQLSGPSSALTFRDEALRLTSKNLPIYAGIDLGLGPATDIPLTAWDEGFIPMRLRDHLRRVSVRGIDGGIVPLVAEEVVLFQANRLPPPERAPNRFLDFLIAGIAAGIIVAGLGTAARRNGIARLVLAVIVVAWALATGLLGVVLTGLWAFTDHVAAYGNENLLQTNPLALALLVAGPASLLGQRARTFASALALTLAGLSVLGLALRVLPFFDQANGRIIALLLPIHLAMAWSMLQPSTTSPRVDGSDWKWRSREARAAGRHR